MTLQQLRYVVTLAEVGHFARAAEACHVSQSTLSIQLKKLEDYLGVSLFDRSLKRVTPTLLGREVVVHAQVLLAEAQRIRTLAGSGRLDPMERSLRLGVIPTVAPYLLPRVLPAVHRAHPKLRLLLREQTTASLLADLEAGRLDAVLLSPPVPGANLELLPLYREPFYAAVPADSPLAAKRRVALADLLDEGLLLLEEGHCFRDQALAVCGERRPENEEVQATSLEMLRQMVACGTGSTLLPALAATAPVPAGEAERLVVRPLNAPEPGRQIGFAWRRRSDVEETLRQLAQTLLDNLPGGVLAEHPKSRGGKRLS